MAPPRKLIIKVPDPQENARRGDVPVVPYRLPPGGTTPHPRRGYRHGDRRGDEYSSS